MVSVVTETRSLRTLVFASSSSLVKIPNSPWDKAVYSFCQNSLDGLVCLYNIFNSVFVINPTTGWYRSLPLCGLQQLRNELGLSSLFSLGHANFTPGFGKDKFTGTYKLVWLYNSWETGLENATTCEVFNFSTNAWRYVTSSSPSRIVGSYPDPIFVDGSLDWFTECKETKVLSFDLYTETFQVISKAPFVNNDPFEILLCNLDNRLCISGGRAQPSDMVVQFRQQDMGQVVFHRFASNFSQVWF